MAHRRLSLNIGVDGISSLQIGDGNAANDIDAKGHESGKGLRKKVKANDDVTWSAPPGYGLVIVFPDVSPFTGSPQLIQGQTNTAGTAVEAVSCDAFGNPGGVVMPNARYKYTVILTPPGASPISEDPQIIVDN